MNADKDFFVFQEMACASEDLQYIRCEMTPTSVGGEQQISISGGSQSPI